MAAAFLVQDFQRAAIELNDASLKAQAGQIATQLWGANGQKIADALATGKISIQDLASKASELGTVFSDRILAAQRESNAALAEASAHGNTGEAIAGATAEA